MSQDGSVLIADDSTVVRRLLGDLCLRLGRVVVYATDAEEAARALACGRLEYVVLDADLPGGGAQRALAAAKRLNGARPQFIVMARNPSLEQETLCSLSGAIAYLPKPLSLATLRRLLARPVARRAGAQ